MIRFTTMRRISIALVLVASSMLASCEPPQIYGSIGYSSYDGSYYGGRLRRQHPHRRKNSLVRELLGR